MAENKEKLKADPFLGKQDKTSSERQVMHVFTHMWNLDLKKI
jgi:hypothetical protein